MKIYEASTAPNARRVRMFLAEKNVDIEYVQLDIGAGENLSPENRAKNPTTKIPFLELDDGTCIGETLAICRYFEETVGANPLMGRSALEKAQVEMWQRRVEFHFMMQVGMCFQHSTGYFKDRMTPVPEFGAVSGKAAQKYLDDLNSQLANSQYLVGDYFSVADINLICALDFARVMKIKPTEEHTHLQRWYNDVSARASAKA